MKPKYPTSYHGKHFIAHHNGYDIYQDITNADITGAACFWVVGDRYEWWVFDEKTAKLDIWSDDCKRAALALLDFLYDPSISPNSK